MRLAALWTTMMAVAISLLGIAIAGVGFGGGWVAWLLAPLVMFVGLQLIGLPMVMVCELLDRLGLLPRDWRPLVDEMLGVGALCGLGFWVFPTSIAVSVVVFFCVMYLVRLGGKDAWVPGGAVEVGK